jgi:hypothetical protein
VPLLFLFHRELADEPFFLTAWVVSVWVAAPPLIHAVAYGVIRVIVAVALWIMAGFGFGERDQYSPYLGLATWLITIITAWSGLGLWVLVSVVAGP